MKKIVINILVCILMLGMTQQFLPVTAQFSIELVGEQTTPIEKHTDEFSINSPYSFNEDLEINIKSKLSDPVNNYGSVYSEDLVLINPNSEAIEPSQSRTGPEPPQEVLERDQFKPEDRFADIQSEVLLSVPAYQWRHGCGPTALGMVIGFYDSQGFSDLIIGDPWNQTDNVNQMIASGGDFDNPNPPGSEKHYENYASPEDYYPNMIEDAYITAGRTPHPDDSLADFMDTSKSTRNNLYGWSWSSDMGPAFINYVYQQNPDYLPSFQPFYSSNGTMSWDVLTNEIDSNRPMVFLVDSSGNGSTDHFVTVIGYRTSPTLQYAMWDTWSTSSIRWENFAPIANGTPWGIWGGWSFQIHAGPFSCNAVTDVSIEECSALVALFESTNGLDWYNNANWLTSLSVGSWIGIKVEEGHVTEINLTGNNLSGTIPSDWSSFPNLKRFELSWNNLTGEIPASISTLTELNNLQLAGNQLAGSIPAELGSLSNLDILFFGYNQLTGTIPVELANITNLRVLDLRYNRITGTIPIDLANLSNLQTFNLSGNQLTGSIPFELSDLNKLRGLDLGWNRLSGTIPSEFGNLTNLQYIHLGINQLSGTIPSELGDITNLKYINLRWNQLSGSIPHQLGNLSNLQDLILDNNQLTGHIPPELGGLNNLERLILGMNQLSGVIPHELGNLTNLWELYLAYNQISDSIPSELGNLSNLGSLYLANNLLTGTIPPELGNLSNLLSLLLHGNQLTGAIPSELGNLTNIYSLNLSHNKLVGEIPESLTKLTSLCTPNVTGSPCWGSYGLDLGFNRLATTGLSQELLDFLYIKDPDWYLTQAVEQTISGDTGGTIISNDTNTEISIPPNAVDGDVTFTFAPQPAPAYATGDLYFAGNSFELTAQDSLGNPITTFAQPIIITLHYDEADLGDIPEESLFLYYWDQDSAAWVDVVTTCDSGTYTRNLEENWLSVPICHLSQFALMGMEEVVENSAPVAENQSVETTQDTPLQITLVASDADGDPLTYEIVAGPSFGTLQYAPAELPVLTYSPNPGYFGSDSFTFKAYDGELYSNIATVTITISEKEDENTAPVAEDQSVETDQDTPLQITLSAYDADGNPLTYIIVDEPDYGTLDYDPDDLPTLTYTSNPGWFGQDSFTFKVNDGQVDSNNAIVTITVRESSESSGFMIFLPLITK